MEQSRNGQEQYERAYYPYDEQRYCTAIRSIDTVRALHQTVVSLRSALDESRQEIEKLKKQIVINHEIQEARHLQHTIDDTHTIDYKSLGEKVTELEKFYNENKFGTSTGDDLLESEPAAAQAQAHTSTSTIEEKTTAAHTKTTKIESSFKNEQGQTISVVPDIKISTHPSGSGSTGNMASRIDVKIKVSSNINVDSHTETDTSERSDTSKQEDENLEKDETGSEHTMDEDALKTPRQENPEIEVYEDKTTNTFNVDAKNLKIKVTSEENLNVTKSVERICLQQSSSEFLNLDIDELSEGDNSVFTEGATTPIEQRMQQVEDIETDNEGGEVPDEDTQKEERDKDDIPEEVDDIELIFSSDDNKDLMQEDLVSISEFEPWQAPGSSGTPVLIKFSTLGSEDRERELYYEKKRAYKAAKQAKQKLESQSTTEKSIESTDSFSFDMHNKNSLDYKSSSLEKDSSIEQNTLSRETSLDLFKPNSLGLNRKWTNVNVLIETDISKIGISDNENILEMGRRNTCPNPPIYRPIIHSQNRSSARNPLAVKFTRSPRGFCPIFTAKSPKFTPTLDEIPSTSATGAISKTSKCTSSVQTDISALPHQWRSETQLMANDYCGGLFTLPSRYSTPHHPFSIKSGHRALRMSEKTQEARRILLSDINFTSMVPELSRSADHLCHQKIKEETEENEIDNDDDNYFKGNLLKTPDYATRGITPSFSMTSPGVSQWTVNESTTQTDGFWGNRGDSFDSTKSYSLRSGNSTGLLSRHHRSRSVPSIRCLICKQNHAHNSIRPSESMQYSKRNVTLQETLQKTRGSLPDLRHECTCPRRFCAGKHILHCVHRYSSGSTDSLLEEADEFINRSVEEQPIPENEIVIKSVNVNRRCSENDIQRDYRPSKQALPFLPKSPKCLKPGHLAKVIAKSGRVVVGRIRYVGPLASAQDNGDETYIGLQLPNNFGDSDGTVDGRKFFDCEPNYGIFVPYKKVIMAWNS